MPAAHLGLAVQVRNGARHPENSRHRAHAEAQSADGLTERPFGVPVGQPTMRAQVSAFEVGVERALPCVLSCPCL